MEFKTATNLELANVTEEALGMNLTWLADALDLQIRQGDTETTKRLADLNEGWKAITHLQKRLKEVKQ